MLNQFVAGFRTLIDGPKDSLSIILYESSFRGENMLDSPGIRSQKAAIVLERGV
jgi:hypothetical protein